jgi:DNA-directed RNA polymerase specialized sigma24 family protein
MFKEINVTQESFDALLSWLDNDRETAGKRYEQIRNRLVRIFVGRACPDADYLADETLSRVAVKFPGLERQFVGEPVFYFHGVARLVHLEWLRRSLKTEPLTIDPIVGPEASTEEHDCLETCLDELSKTQRELITQYYQGERLEKIDNRREIAARLGISANALQGKVSRIRCRLRCCIASCVTQKTL